jgi:hypothetical protein
MNNTVTLFTNWTSQDFTGVWDKQPTLIKAGESTYLPTWLADHFAKHLINQELYRNNKHLLDPQRDEMTKKCFAGKIETSSPVEAEIKVLNQNKEVKEVKKFCDKCDSKGITHKKNCPNNPKNRETFEGLK